MSLLRLLNPQGIAGLAASLCLALLLLLQVVETRHWRKQSGQLDRLYRNEQAAFARTVADYRAAADAARAADRAAAERVRAEQQAVNERIAHDYEARLATARNRARRLQLATAAAGADPCRGRTTPVPGLSGPACGADQTAGEDRLPAGDALIATEQAIQLDALIDWVKRQSRIDPNASR